MILVHLFIEIMVDTGKLTRLEHREWEKCSSMLLVTRKTPNAVSLYFPPSICYDTILVSGILIE